MHKGSQGTPLDRLIVGGCGVQGGFGPHGRGADEDKLLAGLESALITGLESLLEKLIAGKFDVESIQIFALEVNMTQIRLKHLKRSRRAIPEKALLLIEEVQAGGQKLGQNFVELLVF